MGRGQQTISAARVGTRGLGDRSARQRCLAGLRAMGLDDTWEVGGVVRDRLMGRADAEIGDLDFVVVGMTDQQLLEKCRQAGRAEELTVAGQLVGIRFRAPFTPSDGIELALARKEVSTGPGHQDFAIVPGPEVSLDEDLRRRDFTVNAIAENIHTGERRDPFGGSSDIATRRLRTVSPDAFRDDPLRILRGLSRIAKDDLTPSAETLEQMETWADGIKHLSGERIRDELSKMLSGPHAAKALRLGRDHGALAQALPEWAPVIGFDQESKFHDLTADEHILLVVERAVSWNASPAVRWAALLHDIGKPASAWRGKEGRLHFYHKRNGRFRAGDPYPIEVTKEDELTEADRISAPDSHERIGAKLTVDVLQRLHADRHMLQAVELLVSEHMYRDDADFADRSVEKQALMARRFIHRVGREQVEDLMLLRRCDRASKNLGPLPEGWDRDLNAFEAVVRQQMNAPLTVRELAISGHDLLGLGLQGPAIGQTLQTLLDRVLVRPADNDPTRLLEQARKLAHQA
jgi:tRNA nucleotidyltransferase/poly(A) polymerase